MDISSFTAAEALEVKWGLANAGRLSWDDVCTSIEGMISLMVCSNIDLDYKNPVLETLGFFWEIAYIRQSS